MRIVIYKDDFDPIEMHHISIITELLNGNHADEVWVVLDNKKAYFSLKQRLCMCKKELKGLNKVRVLVQNQGSYYDYVETFKLFFKNDTFIDYDVCSGSIYPKKRDYILNQLKNNKIPFPFLSMRCYKYLKDKIK